MKRAKVTEELAYGTALDRLTSTDKPAPAPKEMEPVQQPKAAAKTIANATVNTTMIKLSVFLNSEEDAYLETLASTAKFSGGKKLSKTKLIEAMVRAFKTTDIDVRGVKTDEELFKRVIAQLRQ